MSTQKWFTRSEQQRNRCIRKIKNASLQQNLTEKDVCIEGACPLDPLNLPDNVKKSLWKKAQTLTGDEASMVLSPGSTSDWIVKSASGQ